MLPILPPTRAPEDSNISPVVVTTLILDPFPFPRLILIASPTFSVTTNYLKTCQKAGLI